jgi:5-methyltetrahydropteroyltriglutamate--homocysteine methyltransferase
MRADATERGEDVSMLPKQYCQLINAALASKPRDMTAGVHLCKGNFRSTFFAQGSEQGYAPIAETMFKEVCGCTVLICCADSLT